MSSSDPDAILDPDTGLVLSVHAFGSMAERSIGSEQVLFVVETGESWVQDNGKTFFQAHVGGRWLAVVRVEGRHDPPHEPAPAAVELGAAPP